MSERGSCKSCGAHIVWVKSVGGKPMPLDAKTEKRIVVDDRNYASVVDTYVSHFATCPQASQHRGK